MAGVDGDRDGPNGGDRLHQRPLIPAGDVDESGVVGGVVRGVVVARPLVLGEQKRHFILSPPK